MIFAGLCSAEIMEKGVDRETVLVPVNYFDLSVSGFYWLSGEVAVEVSPVVSLVKFDQETTRFLPVFLA